MGSYPEFIKRVDTVVMGWNTYHQIVTELSPDEWVYKRMKSYVITHQKLTGTEEIITTDQPLDELVVNLKQQEGKDIWICGGIRLFDKEHEELKLKLMSTQSYNGMTDLVYERRENAVED